MGNCETGEDKHQHMSDPVWESSRPQCVQEWKTNLRPGSSLDTVGLHFTTINNANEKYYTCYQLHAFLLHYRTGKFVVVTGFSSSSEHTVVAVILVRRQERGKERNMKINLKKKRGNMRSKEEEK